MNFRYSVAYSPPVHVAAAAPRLVAHAPVLDVEGLAVAVGGALVGEGEAPARGVAVGHPVVKLLRAARADVGREVRLGPHQPAETHELVDAELVGLRGVRAPQACGAPSSCTCAAAGRRADAVAPVVAVREAAARPAQVRRADPLHVVHELLADAVDVRDLRVAADPDAVVDDAAEVLDEVPVEVRADGRAGNGGGDARPRRRRRRLRAVTRASTPRPAPARRCLRNRRRLQSLRPRSGIPTKVGRAGRPRHSPSSAPRRLSSLTVAPRLG